MLRRDRYRVIAGADRNNIPRVFPFIQSHNTLPTARVRIYHVTHLHGFDRHITAQRCDQFTRHEAPTPVMIVQHFVVRVPCAVHRNA
jgi:hypothetical protein